MIFAASSFAGAQFGSVGSWVFVAVALLITLEVGSQYIETASSGDSVAGVVN